MSCAKRNTILFVLFRILFNARFYYPVLGILFLDLGLTLEQYSLLNVAWAVTIVCLEVPSGAIADQIGRKRMVIIAGALMVLEMAIMAFAPKGPYLFAFLLLNRVLSGAAEASASGADEALTFDSLKVEGRESEWPTVLARLMRWQSIAFFIAMLLGAAVYDVRSLRAVLGFIGLPLEGITQEVAVRFPVYLTLASAIMAFFCALLFHETPRVSANHPVTVRSTICKTLAAGAWILNTPRALVLILAGLCFDSVIRLFLTFTSNYYRLIQLPEASFGVLGSVFALLGFVTAPLAQRAVTQRGPVTNFAIVAVLAFIGLFGAAFATPFFGLWVSVPLGMAWSFLSFFLSQYINEIVPEEQRATVLSFRGLALNLGYGAIGLLFAALTRWLADHTKTPSSPEAVFGRALWWLPGYFAATVILLATGVAYLNKRGSQQKHEPWGNGP